MCWRFSITTSTHSHPHTNRCVSRDGPTGLYAPEVLLGLLFYGYATGMFSSRKIERATYEAVPFRFIAGNQHPDHDTLATFRRTFLPELKDLFVQVLMLARGQRAC
jgi:transposase